MRITTQDYGQFLVNGVENFTATYFAETVENLKHDSVTRHLNGSKLSSKAIWERVCKDIIYSEIGYLIFDDTVLDKSHSQSIELARWQYSGTVHDTVMGIGVVNCIYYNPEIDEYWVIDSRIYQPEQDGKKKYDHLKDMLLKAIERGVQFKTVLMDTWYAIAALMCWIDGLGYKFVCPVRKNRQVLDHWTDPKKTAYRAVSDLPWSDNHALTHGRCTKLKQCHLSLKLFQLTTHPRRTDYIVTNDHKAILSSDDATKACAARWKIEQFHRETKQLTGIAKCQARKSKPQRKHIITAILAWLVLHAKAKALKTTIYAVKHEPLKQFQAHLWRNPYTVFG